MPRLTFRFPCKTRILGTILQIPNNFKQPVLALTDPPQFEVEPGQEELLARIEQENKRDNYWAIKHSDFYGEPASLRQKLKHNIIKPNGVLITPKFIDGYGFDGQWGFPVLDTNYIREAYNDGYGNVSYYAEFLIGDTPSRYGGKPSYYEEVRL